MKLKKKLSFVELNGFIGQKQRIPVRVAFFRRSKEAEEKDLKEKLRKRSSKSPVSDLAKLFCGVSVLMTNADMSIEEMRQSYRLRWAIELIFKTWKSDFDLDKIKNVNQYRYLVMLYAKLIVLLLSSASVRQIILRAEHRNRKKISFHSAMSLFRKHYLMRILDCLRTGDFKKINKLFSEAEAHFIRNCIYQPKKNPPEKDSLDSIFEQVQKLEKLYA